MHLQAMNYATSPTRPQLFEDSSIHQINYYLVHTCQQSKPRYPLDSDLSIIYPLDSINHLSNSPGQEETLFLFFLVQNRVQQMITGCTTPMS